MNHAEHEQHQQPEGCCCCCVEVADDGRWQQSVVSLRFVVADHQQSGVCDWGVQVQVPAAPPPPEAADPGGEHTDQCTSYKLQVVHESLPIACSRSGVSIVRHTAVVCCSTWHAVAKTASVWQAAHMSTLLLSAAVHSEVPGGRAAAQQCAAARHAQCGLHHVDGRWLSPG